MIEQTYERRPTIPSIPSGVVEDFPWIGFQVGLKKTISFEVSIFTGDTDPAEPI
jgi:hypothetical protein